MFFSSHRLRDLTLRSISLTSKRNYFLFHQSLLQTISIKPSDLHAIYALLERDGQAGKAIKLLSIADTSENADTFKIPYREKINVKIANVSSCGDSCPHHHPVADNEKALRLTLGFVLHHLDNLQTLILHYPPLFKLPLIVDQVAKSLVKLHIGKGLSLKKPGQAQGQEHISGKNLIWLLLFCPFLRQVILSGCITVEDERHSPSMSILSEVYPKSKTSLFPFSFGAILNAVKAGGGRLKKKRKYGGLDQESLMPSSIFFKLQMV